MRHLPPCYTPPRTVLMRHLPLYCHAPSPNLLRAILPNYALFPVLLCAISRCTVTRHLPTCYAPSPVLLEDSPYYRDKYFLYPSSFFSPVDSNCSFIGGGDFNSRVGDVSPLSGARYRKNPDANVNSHGKMIKKVCKACNVCGEQFINWR